MLLKKLHKVIKSKGFLAVSNELNYKSNSTIKHWFRNGKVPPLAQERLVTYLKGVKK